MRVKQVIGVRKEFVDDVPLPPVEWFVRGPRGGVYLATGQRTRERASVDVAAEWFWTGNDDWLWVIDTSEDARYVRPGTVLHRQGLEALGET